MRVAVLGATGVIGRHVVQRLIERGHAPLGIVRDAADAEDLRQGGAEAVIADMFDEASLGPAVDGCDAAIHLATAIPAPGGRQDWSMNDRIRREGTANLLGACRRSGVRKYVQQSIAFLAGGTSDLIDEEAPLLPGNEVTASAIDMERIVSASETEWTIIRDGALYGPGTGREEGWRKQAREEALLSPGDGSDFISLVHVADLAQAFVLAAEEPAVRGVVAVADDAPVTYGELFGHLAGQVDGGRTGNGGMATMPSFRVSNAQARTSLGWRPFYRSYRSGLAA